MIDYLYDADYDSAVEQVVECISEIIESAELKEIAEGVLMAYDIPEKFTLRVVKQALERYADKVGIDREMDLANNAMFSEIYE